MDASSNVTIDDLVIDHDALYESIRKSFRRDPFDHYVNGICGLFFCLLGTLSNALSFSVLIRRTMRLSTYVYLAGLCLSDFTACFGLLPGYILDAYPVEAPDFELPRTYTYTKILIIAGAISTTARALSVWLCVAFTIDRWIMICRPFVGPLYCTIKNARRVTILIYMLGVFYAAPLMFEHEVHEENSLSEILPITNNKKIYRYMLSEFGSNSVFRWTYALINALGVYVIPLTIIAILNRQLFLSIRSLEQRSAEYNAPLPTKQGVTVMLLATTLMLLVFRLPSAAVSIMWLISAKMFITEKPPFPLRKFHSIANLCATFNAATTFIMFIIYGTKFRSEFNRIYCAVLSKIKASRRNRLMLTEESRQTRTKQTLLSNDTNEHKHDHNNTQVRVKILAPNNSSRQTARHIRRPNFSASSVLARASISSILPMRHPTRLSRTRAFTFGQEYDSIVNRINKHTPGSPEQYTMTVRQNRSNDNDNDTKSASSPESYLHWFTHCVDPRR